MYKNDQNRSSNPLLQLSFEFALAIIKYCERIEADRKYVIARQLLRCGTSVGANIREAQNAESRADFIHKLKISAKEAGETEYWLLLCQSAGSFPDTGELLEKISALIRLLGKIISTAKRNLRKK